MRDRSDSNELMIVDDEPGLARWLPTVVVTGVVVGFVTLAWYAYHAGTQPVREDDLMVVEADKTPIKEKPADPGGMKFPNQDKTIFETFTGNNAQQPAKVERVLPPPEEPMPREGDSGTTTWINENVKKQADNAAEGKPQTEQVFANQQKPVDPEAGEVSAKEEAPHAAQQPAKIEDDQPETYVAESIAKQAKQEVAKAEPAAAKPAAHDDKPAAPVEVKEVPVKTQAVKADAKKADHAQAPKAAAAAPAAGGTKVQLGAYRSEKEAHDAWNKMLKKNSALSGKQPQIVKADLGAKGVYFRLRVGGFDSSTSAKAFCSKLSANGQGCMPVVK